MTRMTIARQAAGQPKHGPAGAPAAASPGHVAKEDASPVPAQIRRDRLDAQIASFVRAGYRVETRSGDVAVLIRPRTARPVRDTVLMAATLGLALVPRLLGFGARQHRVIVTVDRSGVVRLA